MYGAQSYNAEIEQQQRKRRVYEDMANYLGMAEYVSLVSSRSFRCANKWYFRLFIRDDQLQHASLLFVICTKLYLTTRLKYLSRRVGIKFCIIKSWYVAMITRQGS